MTTNRKAIEAAIEAAERNASRKIGKPTAEEKARKAAEPRDWPEGDYPTKKPRARTKPAAKTPAKKAAPARKQPAKKTAQTPAKSPAKAARGKPAPKGKASSRKIAATPTPAPKPEPKPEPVEIIMGRPVKYTDEITHALIKYFDIRVDRVENVMVPDKDGKLTEEKQVIVNDFPTLTRFAHEWGLTRQTLKNWADALNEDGSRRYPDFFYAYTRAKEAQESLIVEGGMAGKYESRFVVFASKNLIGWRDQVEQTVTANVTATSRESLDAIYEAGIEESNRAREQRMAERREMNGDE
jgi:hypothetical protein